MISLKKILPKAVIITLLMACLSCQSGFIYHPESALVATPASVRLDYQEVRFKAADGVNLHAWWVPAKNERGVALFCHGNAGNISHRLKTIETLNALGLSTFIFDYRGFGLSEGSPSEKGTYADARGAWEYLVRERNIDPGKIIIHGRSLGGAVAAHLATERNPALLILESSFTSTRDVARHHVPFPPVAWIITYRYETIGRIRKLKCPVLVIHSPDDEVIPFSHGVRLFNSAPEPREFLKISGSHNNGFILSYREYSSAIDIFIGKHLRGDRK